MTEVKDVEFEVCENAVDVFREADEKNSQRIAADLQELGELYENAMIEVECGKKKLKSILEDADHLGITKKMIEAYLSLKNFNDLNRFAIWGAVNEKSE